jgi:two-component system sensor histidine kinase VicK
MALRVELYRNLYQDLMKRGVRVRALTEITKENLSDCKELRKQSLVCELRHLEGVKGNFAVSEKEYLAVSNITEHAPVTELICSNDEQIVAQNQYVFDNLWGKGISSEVRFRELEEGLEREETEIVAGIDETTARIMEFFRRSNEELSICATSTGPSVSMGLEAYRRAFVDIKEKGLSIRYLTEITRANLAHSKELLRYVDLRHIAGIKSNFGFNERELTATTVEMRANELIPQMLYSNSRSIVEQQRYIFALLWNNAIPAEAKISELEGGLEPEETRLISDMNEATKIRDRAIEESKEEILMILPFESSFLRGKEGLQKISKRQQEHPQLKVRVLAPKVEKETAQILPGAEIRSCEPVSIGVVIYDGARMFLTEYSDLEAKSAKASISSMFYTTNRQTIAGLVSVFEALWKERELREREQANRMQAQLLHDILTHDIRNYNQAARLSPEILRDDIAAKSDGSVAQVFESLLKSIDGSTHLLDRAMKLSKIIAQGTTVPLHPVSLEETVEDSIEKVKVASVEGN